MQPTIIIEFSFNMQENKSYCTAQSGASGGGSSRDSDDVCFSFDLNVPALSLFSILASNFFTRQFRTVKNNIALSYRLEYTRK